MAPADSLLAAGVQPEGKAVYELANGQPIEYQHVHVWLEFLGERAVTRIIFGPPKLRIENPVRSSTISPFKNPITLY
jgi:hypothetical protein